MAAPASSSFALASSLIIIAQGITHNCYAEQSSFLKESEALTGLLFGYGQVMLSASRR